MSLVVDKIIHIEQPTLNTCVSTCIAMLIGQDVGDVIEKFHDRYFNKEIDVHNFFDEIGIKYNHLDMLNQEIEFGKVYLAAVPSLNISGKMHQVIFDTRNKEFNVFDPNYKKEGKKYYVWENDIDESEGEVLLDGYVLNYEIVP